MKTQALILAATLGLVACGGEPPVEQAAPTTSVVEEAATIGCSCLPGAPCLDKSIQVKFSSDDEIPPLTNRYVVASQGVVRTDVDRSVTGTLKATCTSIDNTKAGQIFAFHMVSAGGHVNCDLSLIKGTGTTWYRTYGNSSDVCVDSTYAPAPIQTFRPFDNFHYLHHFILQDPAVVGVSGPAMEIGALYMFQINTFGDRYMDQNGLVSVSKI